MAVLRPVALTLLGLAMFLGLPLLAWGVGDLQGFLAHPARTAYAALTVVQVLAMVPVAVRVPHAGRSRGQERTLVRRQRVAVPLIRLASLAIVLWAPYADRRELAVIGGELAVREVGLGLYLIGFVGIVWTALALGKQLSLHVTIQEGHQLVTTGPYRYIRNPRYLAVVAFMLGFALTFRSWAGVAGVGVLALIFLWRIHDEEALLAREFGPAWRAYASRSWRLVPLLY